MKNLIFLILSIVFPLFGLTQNGCPERSDRNYKCGNIEESILPRLTDIVFSLETEFEFKLNSTFNRKKDQDRAEEILKLVNQVINDPDFWKALEHYDRYQYSKWSKSLKDNWIDITGKQITNCMINGNPESDVRPKRVSVDLNVKLYGLSFATPFESAVAKEVGDGTIYNKRWFFRKHSKEAIGSNWIHEFAHSQGIRHCFKCNEARDYSIPYVINRIFKEVAQKYN
jgi:hypothetical protein